MTSGRIVGSIVLVLSVVLIGGGLALWKARSIAKAIAESSNMPEQQEAVSSAIAIERPYQRSTTVIGTVVSLRSVMLRNELAGTVRKVDLTPGKIVNEGDVLVELDVSVEQAELAAAEAQSVLAETVLERTKDMKENKVASATELDRARAERDVALAQIAKNKAIIARRTIKAPFKARVGLSDVHPGQYLLEGTLLTTLQGVDDAVHVDFSVPQRFAAGLKENGTVEVLAQGTDTPVVATIVASDSRVDPATRNAYVRAKIDDATKAPKPGSSVRVRVPVGPKADVVVVPASALRKGPSGDHVFVLKEDEKKAVRAVMRPVTSGELMGDYVIIRKGLEAKEKVAAAGSFKLREGLKVAIVPDPADPATRVTAQAK